MDLGPSRTCRCNQLSLGSPFAAITQHLILEKITNWHIEMKVFVREKKKEKFTVITKMCQ